MSAWSGYRHGVGSVSESVAGVIATAINTIAEPVSDLPETAGHAIQDLLDAMAGLLSRVPVVGPLFRWLGGLVAAVTNLLGAAVKAPLGLAGGVAGGAIRLLGGILGLHGTLLGRGLGDLASSVVAAVVLPVGKVIALVQGVFFVQKIERPLSSAERAILKRVFRGSTAFYNLRLVIGRSGVFAVNDRPFTLGNTIYMKQVDPAVQPEVLVHESTHGWQYQHLGARYAVDALAAQFFVGDAYSWEKEISRGNTQWPQFNKEAEAQLFEDLYRDGALTSAGSTSRGNGLFFDADGTTAVGSFVYAGTDRTDLATRAVAVVRKGWCVRLSGLWS